jgi:hypothetical protein
MGLMKGAGAQAGDAALRPTPVPPRDGLAVRRAAGRLRGLEPRARSPGSRATVPTARAAPGQGRAQGHADAVAPRLGFARAPLSRRGYPRRLHCRASTTPMRQPRASATATPGTGARPHAAKPTNSAAAASAGSKSRATLRCHAVSPVLCSLLEPHCSAAVVHEADTIGLAERDAVLEMAGEVVPIHRGGLLPPVFDLPSCFASGS